MEQLASIDPLYVISGVLVGGLVGFTGVGGGSLMTPLLILFFGIHPASAVGTDLLYAAATKTAGSAVHGFNKTIDWRVVGRLAAGSVPMTILTVAFLYWLGIDSKATQALITKMLGVALLFTAASLIMRKYLMQLYDQRFGELDPKLVGPLTVLVGAILGCLVTISSVGAGAIGVTALVFLYPKMRAQLIVGSDIAHAVPPDAPCGPRAFDPRNDRLPHIGIFAGGFNSRDRHCEHGFSAYLGECHPHRAGGGLDRGLRATVASVVA